MCVHSDPVSDNSYSDPQYIRSLWVSLVAFLPPQTAFCSIKCTGYNVQPFSKVRVQTLGPYNKMPIVDQYWGNVDQISWTNRSSQPTPLKLYPAPSLLRVFFKVIVNRASSYKKKPAGSWNPNYFLSTPKISHANASPLSHQILLCCLTAHVQEEMATLISLQTSAHAGTLLEHSNRKAKMEDVVHHN